MAMRKMGNGNGNGRGNGKKKLTGKQRNLPASLQKVILKSKAKKKPANGKKKK
jgi:hypothetical protein